MKIGSMCTLIGTVGSGKSTILQVILGELPLDSGHLLVNGTISYASQEPWLFEGTVRQNILFTEKFDEKRFASKAYTCYAMFVLIFIMSPYAALDTHVTCNNLFVSLLLAVSQIQGGYTCLRLATGYGNFTVR